MKTTPSHSPIFSAFIPFFSNSLTLFLSLTCTHTHTHLPLTPWPDHHLQALNTHHKCLWAKHWGNRGKGKAVNDSGCGGRTGRSLKKAAADTDKCFYAVTKFSLCFYIKNCSQVDLINLTFTWLLGMNTSLLHFFQGPCILVLLY